MATPPRDKLTFSQAEGLEPLPTPLKLGELSKELRNALYSLVYGYIDSASKFAPTGGKWVISQDWYDILLAKHVHFDHNPADTFTHGVSFLNTALKATFFNSKYNVVFDLLEFFMRHEKCPGTLSLRTNETFARYRAAYRVVEPGPSIIPFASPEEGRAVAQAFADLGADQFSGARKHLHDAGVYLGQPGKEPDCIRESIHAVEAVCGVLAHQPKASLDDALKILASKVGLHGGFRTALGNLYGYASDERGIRHSLLEAGEAKVDPRDAQFMFGACASFVSYLIGKARVGGLL